MASPGLHLYKKTLDWTPDIKPGFSMQTQFFVNIFTASRRLMSPILTLMWLFIWWHKEKPLYVCEPHWIFGFGFEVEYFTYLFYLKTLRFRRRYLEWIQILNLYPWIYWCAIGGRYNIFFQIKNVFIILDYILLHVSSLDFSCVIEQYS